MRMLLFHELARRDAAFIVSACSFLVADHSLIEPVSLYPSLCACVCERIAPVLSPMPSRILACTQTVSTLCRHLYLWQWHPLPLSAQLCPPLSQCTCPLLLLQCTTATVFLPPVHLHLHLHLHLQYKQCWRTCSPSRSLFRSLLSLLVPRQLLLIPSPRRRQVRRVRW